MVKVTIEFDGGAEVFTGDAVSCVVMTNEPDGTRSCSMLKGAFAVLSQGFWRMHASPRSGHHRKTILPWTSWKHWPHLREKHRG